MHEIVSLFQGLTAANIQKSIADFEEYIKLQANGETIIDGGGMPVKCPEFEYKHFFPDDMYVRQLVMPADTLITSMAFAKSYPLFLLAGTFTSISSEGIEDFEGPCFVIAPSGNKRIVLATSELKVVTVHQNPNNYKNEDLVLDTLAFSTMKDFYKFKNK
jgi:hypothetical protein